MSDLSHKSSSSRTPDEAIPVDPALDFAVLVDSVSNSDNDSLGLGTAMAPSCPARLEGPRSETKPVTFDDYKRGDRIDDFEILALLGRGAFGAVYLARQMSLDREVALKITAWQASEGRKMARLEHENIVQVFSEVAIDTGTMLLCMQYVPGPTLQAVLDSMAATDRKNWSGRLLLETVDRLAARPASFDPASARNREALEAMDWVETVCWIGARLAEALDYAHARGVVHRDIKPGNIMISQYGRPMLVDFNLASQKLDNAKAEESIGGTLAYMAPEHLDAFISGENLPPDVAPHAADIYSLGVVLYQMACGELPFTMPSRPSGESKADFLRALAAARHALPPALPAELPKSFDQLLARCMDPVAEKRFATSRELSDALEGCRHADGALRKMPDFGRFNAIVSKHPFVWLAILGLVPQIVATRLKIVYDMVEIIGNLSPAQRLTFRSAIVVYNCYGYIIGIAISVLAVLPVFRAWQLLDDRMPPDRKTIDAARRLVTAWPRVSALTSCIGWLPGGIVFPLWVTLASGPLPMAQWAHFVFSSTVSGLIALTYTALAVQWLVLCIIYPRLWVDWAGFRTIAAAELRAVPRRLLLLQILAGVIPLAGAVLSLISYREGKVSQAFLVLVVGLIALGAAGFCAAMFTATLLSRALAALTGTDEISKKSHRGRSSFVSRT